MPAGGASPWSIRIPAWSAIWTRPEHPSRPRAGRLLGRHRRRCAPRRRRCIDRLGEDLDLRRPVRELSLAQRQIIEIARALGSDARLLILDEPTSALTPPEVDRLFAILRQLRAAGTSHHLHLPPAARGLRHRRPDHRHEGRRDRRHGRGGRDRPGSHRRHDGRARPRASLSAARRAPSALRSSGRDISSAPGEFSDVSFTAHAGEILGFGGITGSGQQAIVRALFGLLPASGSITVDGRAVTIANPAQAIEQGIVYLPADRPAKACSCRIPSPRTSRCPM